MNKPATNPRPNTGGVFSTMVAVAGIGGAGLVVLVFVYRDLIRANIFPTLAPRDGAVVVGLLIAFTFFAAVLAMYVWLANSRNRRVAQQAWLYVLLVTILMLSVLGVMYALNVRVEARDEPSLLRRGYDALLAGELNSAQRFFDQARLEQPRSPDPLYWQARLALEQNNLDVARHLTQRALDADPHHRPSLVQALEIRLLAGDDPSPALERLEVRVPEDEALARWLACLRERGLLDDRFVTRTGLRNSCELPVRVPV